MSTSGLASPPRASPRRASRPEAPPPPARPPAPERKHPSFERVLRWSLAVSVAVHLILLLLSPLFIRVGLPPGELSGPEAEAPARFGMEGIIPIPSETAPEIPAPEATEPVVPTPVTPPPAAAPATPRADAPGVAPAPDEAGPESARDALRPGFRDPRLYVPPRTFPEADRTEHDRYMEHLQARIDALNDSMNVAAARDRAGTDWTVTDERGRRWGISPEGVHLGGVSIPREVLPMPAPTGDNQSLEAERERQRQREEIRRQEEAAERRRIEEGRNQSNGGGS